MNIQPTVLLFDLGGVLIQLDGLPIRNEWIKGHQSAEESWQNWLHSDAARGFETGKLDAGSFAEMLISEMSLSIAPTAFLEHFRNWPTGLYPGVLPLLESLALNFQLAVFSNSNELHWPRKLDEMELAGKFDHYFASHLMGLAKPDPAAFEFVLRTLDIDARQILFLYDNQLNVDAARELGMQSVRVQGFDAVVDCLQSRGLTGAASRAPSNRG